MRSWLLAALLALGAAMPQQASAQAYPAKVIRLIVGFAPGGVADITARLVAPKLSEALGQQVIVDNRQSAGGILAAELVAKADPDGHTLLLISGGNAVSASLYKALSYDPINDFAMVSTLAFFDLVIVADPAFPGGSVADLVAAARAKPGTLNFGTVGIGSTQHLAGELFRSMAGIDAVPVSYRATPALMNALKGREVDVMFEILAPVLGQIRQGALKPIAVTSARRFAGLPEVPTAMESGLPGYDVASWNGIAAPAKTPPAIIERLNRELVRALALPEIQQRFTELGVEARSSTPDWLKAFLVSESEKWGRVIAQARIEKQ